MGPDSYSGIHSSSAVGKLETTKLKTHPGERNFTSLAPKIKLADGFSVPQIGLGTWKAEKEKATQAVKDAIDVGYRHIDCAMVYGNEVDVGQGILEKLQEGVVTREDLFITSKAWNTFHSKGLVVEAACKSLTDLQLTYLDLYLIHFPMGYKEGAELYPLNASGEIVYSDVDYVETWKGMEECQRRGLVRSIGLSNFNSQQIQRVWDSATVKPVMLQVECHPYLKQKKLVEFCKQKNMAVTAYSCLGSPTRACASTEEPVVMEDSVINEIARSVNRTPAQVLLRYQVERGIIVIPKSVTRERIQSNFKIFDFELTQKQASDIDNIDQNIRLLHQNKNKKHPAYPFHLPF